MPAFEVTFEPLKTYSTKERMKKAISDKDRLTHGVRYVTLQTDEGRYYPAFLYNERRFHELGIMPIHFAQAGWCIVGA